MSSRILHKLLASILSGFISIFILSGCAGQFAYWSGKNLVKQDKVEEGLAKFQEAAQRNPANAEYREAYLQTRERSIYAYLEQAGQLAAANKRSEAEKLYQRILAIDSGNDRARAGLNMLERDERHRQWLKEGQTALEKNDITQARQKLTSVLAENPDNPSARTLQRAIADKTAQPPIESALSAFYRKPISIEFKDTALKQVFEVIARTSGLNFIFDKEVKLDQRTSIFLKNSTIESAIHFTLLTNQLEQQVLDSNTILIYPNTAAKLKDYQEMVVKSFFLSNADAKTVANTLKTIIKSRDIVIDEKLNMLIVRDSPDAIKLAEKLVALHDVQEPEVMLEVEILEVKRTRLMELGIQWPNSLTLTPLPSTSGGSLTVRDLRNHLNGNTIGAGIGSATLRVRKEDGDANLLANPRIRARNHEKAKILIGERVPNITTTATSSGFVSESINYVDVGLKLDVEPTIYLDDDVAIRIALEVSSVTNQIKTPSGSVAYQIGTRTASTVLRLKDGENQVLAGLINDEDRRNGNKVPGLGELPLIGRLFGSTLDDTQKTEIVLSITPRLIRNIQRPDAALSEFRSGTDSSFRTRPEAVTTTPLPNKMNTAQTNTAPKPATAASPIAAPTNAPAAPATAPPHAYIAPNNITKAGDARLEWQGPAKVKVGETFTVQVKMQSDTPVTTAPVTIGFDNRILQITNVTEGVFLKQNDAQTKFTSQVSNGQIIFSGTRIGTTGATAEGTLATISFRALAPNDAMRLQLIKATPIGIDNQPIAAALPAPLSVQILP